MIVHTHNMAEKRNPLGPTGETVRANVERLRDDQNLGYAKLASILKGVGREIPELGLRRIESGDRRVDVDDLLALAVAFGVSPVALLMPAIDNVQPDEVVSATAVPGPVTAEHLWGWLTAAYPMGDVSLFAFAERSWPRWVRDKWTRRLTEAQKRIDDQLHGRVSDGDD